MKRRAPHEHVEPFRDRLARPGAESLRDRLADWAEANLDELRATWPEMPDRHRRPCRRRVGTAARYRRPCRRTVAGPRKSRRSHAQPARAERDPSLGVQLLADCRRIFDAGDVDRLTTEALLEALLELDESPWADLRGKPLDARGLARRLRKYDVRPDVHRFDESAKRGYLRETFHDAWTRYLPESTPVTHVTHPQENRDATQPVTSPEAEQEYDLLSIPGSLPLSDNGDAQHAQHPQHDLGESPPPQWCPR